MTKVRLVLDAIDKPYAFVAVDIASGQLEQAAGDLEAAYPELRVQTIATDFTNVICLPDWLHSAIFPQSSCVNIIEPYNTRERSVLNYRTNHGRTRPFR